MTRLIRTCALMTALAAFAGGATTLVVAQEKKKTEKKADSKNGTIEIYKAKNGLRYRVKNADGKTIAIPIANAAWDTKKEVDDAINDLKETLNKGKIVEVKE